MNPVYATRRLARALAGLAAAFLTTIAAAPAAFAVPPPQHSAPRPQLPAPVHAAAISGITGWQITVIAAGAALLAAALALAAWRARPRRLRAQREAQTTHT
jgi:capsular polysaccharide biosynthesis protein